MILYLIIDRMIRSIVLASLVLISVCSPPVAIFHGLGDACALEKVTGFPDFIRTHMNNTHVECIESGAFIFSIMLMSF